LQTAFFEYAYGKPPQQQVITGKDGPVEILVKYAEPRKTEDNA